MHLMNGLAGRNGIYFSFTSCSIRRLRNFRYPIIKKSGVQMKENIESWGYENIMKYVWVCHTPIMGSPCGTCHPCELKIETGMDVLMTARALKRYRNRKKKPYIYMQSKKGY